MPTYSFPRGGTISLALDVASGDVNEVTGLPTATLARRAGGPGTPFTVTPRSALPEIPAGWNLTIAAEVSAQLAPGFYRAEARLQVAGGVVVTSQADVRICATLAAAP